MYLFQLLEDEGSPYERLLREIAYVLKDYSYDGVGLTSVTIEDIYNSIKTYGNITFDRNKQIIHIMLEGIKYEISEQTIRKIL